MNSRFSSNQPNRERCEPLCPIYIIGILSVTLTPLLLCAFCVAYVLGYQWVIALWCSRVEPTSSSFRINTNDCICIFSGVKMVRMGENGMKSLNVFFIAPGQIVRLPSTTPFDALCES